MNGCILGFHELALWPKWIPASIRSWTSVLAIGGVLAATPAGRDRTQPPAHAGGWQTAKGRFGWRPPSKGAWPQGSEEPAGIAARRPVPIKTGPRSIDRGGEGA